MTKEDFFTWFRENRVRLSGEELRWAEDIISEYRWHDCFERFLIQAWKVPLPYPSDYQKVVDEMSGLEARLYCDKRLEFADVEKPTAETRAMDFRLAALCKKYSYFKIECTENQHYIRIIRNITFTDRSTCFKSAWMPISLFPEVAALCDAYSADEKKKLRLQKYDKYDKIKNTYYEWQDAGYPRGYDGYGNERPQTYVTRSWWDHAIKTK